MNQSFKVLTTMTALFLSGAVSAQTPPASPPVGELSKAAFLLGRWQGGGWIDLGPGRRAEFKQSETITSRLGGGAIVMEGLGKRTAADGTEIVTHEALGILTWDAKEQKGMMRAYRAGGQFVDADVTLLPNRLIWQFRIAGVGDTRYTIVLNEQGRWFEIGELSKDGSEWRKFFETTLSRVAAPQ